MSAPDLMHLFALSILYEFGAEDIPVEHSTVADRMDFAGQHLGALLNRGLVIREDVGGERAYRITQAGVAALKESEA